ncbi:MAG: FecR family protein [Daejeonella sp.]|uniref:FecR family protein n=1 Tax=Daejeonella sp. TaxID=2805397 RepID=UPI002734DAAC|nr:FecR family protein [Daejeonella sp.]MDP3469685.1 FecR family protein [Daejeonella sp.]
MTGPEAKQLLKKYNQGNCTTEEKALVEHWYQSESSKQSVLSEQDDYSTEKLEMWSEISKMSGIKTQNKGLRIMLWGTSIAAAVLIAISISSNFLKDSEPELVQTENINNVYDKNPGSNKAVLTLADGSKIILDDANKGTIAEQGGINISKAADGSIIYNMPEMAGLSSETVLFNTIETPKGGKYQIILPDGSKVWLNSVSSLRFPAIFNGKERNVELTGEAFFEVAKNTETPFKVKTNDMNVFVTGTQFNVMAYADENYSAATLVEGSVQVSNISSNITLKPGEQVVSNQGSKLSKSTADVEQNIAWKNGLFQFNDTDMRTVMNQISRWYDVSVEYKGSVPEKHFGGYISRDSKLSQVLKILEISGVKFKVEEKKIIVLP